MEIATPGSLLLVWGLYIEAGCLLLVLDSFSLIVFFCYFNHFEGMFTHVSTNNE